MQTNLSKKSNIVVVGNGMVGYKFCEKFALKGGLEHFNLIVIGEEPRPAYDRVHLSEFFAGKSADDLLMAPFSWYTENKITLHTNNRIIKIDRENKQVLTASGEKVDYDRSE